MENIKILSWKPVLLDDFYPSPTATWTPPTDTQFVLRQRPVFQRDPAAEGAGMMRDRAGYFRKEWRSPSGFSRSDDRLTRMCDEASECDQFSLKSANTENTR